MPATHEQRVRNSSDLKPKGDSDSILKGDGRTSRSAHAEARAACSHSSPMEPPLFAPSGLQTVRAAPGSDACLVLSQPSGTPPLQYHWSRAGASLDERFTVSDEAGGVRLTVSAARTGDSGVYTLQASNAAGSDTTRVRLEVSPDEAPTGEDPPTFLRRLQDLTVKVGTRTRFLVEIISSTECKVTWYRNERRLMEAERVALAKDGNFWCADVAAVSVDDAGRWTCTAENAGGRASCSAHLNVLVPKAYKRPEFVDELRALLTEQGTVSLECKVVGVPTPILRWFKDSREIKAGDVFALTANAEDPTSLGTYTCEAVNCMGRAYSSSKVHVVGRGSREGSTRPGTSGMTPEPPPIFTKELEDQLVRICEPLTLGCHVVVPPWPRSVVWYNKEGKIEPSERYHVIEDGVGGYLLEVPSAEWPDEGEWKCVATSAGGRVGISTCYITMDVPKNYRKPRFMENLQAVLTEEGLVSFECKVVGFPTPVLSWFKDGQELKPGDVYQLTGTNSLGSYCCIARNCMGQASSSAELTVEDIQNQLNEEEKLQLFSKNQAPKFIQGLKSVEAKIDEPFRFTFKVAIPPEPSVLWYRDEQPVDESPRCHHGKEDRGVFFLDIQNLEFLDQAEWKCVAMNDFGHSVTSCFLKLIIPRHYKKPRFLENLQAILSEEGAVNLECKVIGVPQPILKWYKDGEELKPGDIHRIISGQDGTCCLGTYTCEAQNCMGIAASSASLLGFDDSMKAKAKKAEEQALQRNLSLSTIHEERTSQMYDTPVGDITLDDKGEISFSFDGKEVSVSLYETPDLTEEEALQIVEMYADQLSENVTEHNVVELPPLRFVKETSTSGNLLMEAIIIDVSPEYFASPEEDLRTEADVEDISIADENGPPQLSLDQDVEIGGDDYLEKTMALLSEEKSDIPIKLGTQKSDSQRSGDDYFSLSREQSISEERRDDDSQAVSESDLQSFASARSSGKPKSKSSKPSGEEGQESSEPTKTIMFKGESKQPTDLETELPAVKAKRERKSSRGSRRSSSSSEKSLSKSKEDLVLIKAEAEPLKIASPTKPTMTDEEFKTKMSSVSSSLSKVINDIQLIERDIILKSELMSSTATATRSLEIISSLISPLSEIHSVADTLKESVSESREVTSTIFNSLPQSLKALNQSLTIIEKCIDVESDNKTLVKKTCVAFIETCGTDMQNLISEITSITSQDYLLTDDTILSEIEFLTNEMTTVINLSADTIKIKNLLSEANEIKTDEPSLETQHLRNTQKAIFELKSPLNSLLCIVESADSGNMIDLAKVNNSNVILNDMSASIQDLQTALEQIESLSVKESNTSLQKYNTEIVENVMESVLKLRSSFEKLSTENKIEDDKTLLKQTLTSIKHNLNEISSQISSVESNVGTFDILQSDNKLDILQKTAQILIALENKLPTLESMPEVKTRMDIFHKNLTKVLENVIETNDSKKYFALMEICEAVNRVNTSIKSIEVENLLPLASLSNTLRIIQDHFVKNVFESELNCSIMSNIADVLVGIQEAINNAVETSIMIDSEHVQDMHNQEHENAKANVIVDHIDQTIAAINTLKSIESTQDLPLSIAPTLENICPILEDLKRSVASIRPSEVVQEEHISDLSDVSFAQTAATPICELNQMIIVLNQLIIENIGSLTENNEVIPALAEPLHELHTTLEILQHDVISQYSEDLTPYKVSINMVSAVQNLQSCILMVQEQAGVDGADDMSTLEDISGIKTTADTIPSDRLVLPTAEEITIEQSLPPLIQEFPRSATAQALQTLNEHIMTLQNPEIIDALDSLSEVSSYPSLKSIALGLGELYSGIEGILHPVLIEDSNDLVNLTNISKLTVIAEPMQELQQSLSVLDTSDIPAYENILELPAEKIHYVIQSISDFKKHLDKCIYTLFPAMEAAENTIEISNKVGSLREVCDQLKYIIEFVKETYSEIPIPREVKSVEEIVDSLLDATDVTKGINIEKVKCITEELYEKIIIAQEEIIQFTSQSSEKLAQEAKFIQIIDEVENNIAVLEQYDFVDLSRTSDIASCMTPQLAMEVESESLLQMDDIVENAVNLVQDSTQETPIEDLMIIENFFKTCKNEFTILRCLIARATSHKKIIRLLQEFSSLQNTINNFKRLDLKLSGDISGCLQTFFFHSDECLKKAQTSLIKIVNSQSELLFDIPMTKLETSTQILNKIPQNKTNTQLAVVVNRFLNIIEVAKPCMNNVKINVIEELQRPFIINSKPEEQVLIHRIEEFSVVIENEMETQTLDEDTKEMFIEILKCIEKHQDYKNATGTNKTLILLKCLSNCTDILQNKVAENKEQSDEVTTKYKLEEGKLKEILTEMLEPLQGLHSQLITVQEQLLSGVEEDSISIDITSTESLVHAITEIHKDMIQDMGSENPTVNNEEICLIMEVDKEIHSIQNSIRYMENVQAVEMVKEITKPIEDIEKSLHTILSTERSSDESKDEFPKDVNSNIDSLENALERYINIAIDLLVTSQIFGIDVTESIQVAVELKNLLKLSPEQLVSSKKVEMKNEKIAYLKKILSKFDWLNTEAYLEDKNWLQIKKLKCVFLTTYQLLAELKRVDGKLPTSNLSDVKKEEKDSELLQHIDQYIELIEIVEEISAVIKLEDIKETINIARELRESIIAIETAGDSEISEQFQGKVRVDQAQLAHKLQMALCSLQVQVLDSAQELAPAFSTDVLQRITKVTAQLQADLAAVTGVHTAVQAPAVITNETIKSQRDKHAVQVSFSETTAKEPATLEQVEIVNQTLSAVQTAVATNEISVTQESDTLNNFVVVEQVVPLKQTVIAEVAECAAITKEVSLLIANVTSDDEKVKTEKQESAILKQLTEPVAVLEDLPTKRQSDILISDLEQAIEQIEDDSPKTMIEKLTQHIDEYVSEDIVEVVNELSQAFNAEELKQSVNIAKELRYVIATSELSVNVETSGEFTYEKHEKQAKLVQQLKTALSTLQNQELESFHDLASTVNKDALQKIVRITQQLNTDLAAVVGTQKDIMEASRDTIQDATKEFYLAVESELVTVEEFDNEVVPTGQGASVRELEEKLGVETMQVAVEGDINLLSQEHKIHSALLSVQGSIAGESAQSTIFETQGKTDEGMIEFQARQVIEEKGSEKLKVDKSASGKCVEPSGSDIFDKHEKEITVQDTADENVAASIEKNDVNINEVTIKDIKPSLQDMKNETAEFSIAGQFFAIESLETSVLESFDIVQEKKLSATNTMELKFVVTEEQIPAITTEMSTREDAETLAQTIKGEAAKILLGEPIAVVEGLESFVLESLDKVQENEASKQDATKIEPVVTIQPTPVIETEVTIEEDVTPLSQSIKGETAEISVEKQVHIVDFLESSVLELLVKVQEKDFSEQDTIKIESVATVQHSIEGDVKPLAQDIICETAELLVAEQTAAIRALDHSVLESLDKVEEKDVTAQDTVEKLSIATNDDISSITTEIIISEDAKRLAEDIKGETATILVAEQNVAVENLELSPLELPDKVEEINILTQDKKDQEFFSDIEKDAVFTTEITIAEDTKILVKEIGSKTAEVLVVEQVAAMECSKPVLESSEIVEKQDIIADRTSSQDTIEKDIIVATEQNTSITTEIIMGEDVKPLIAGIKDEIIKAVESTEIFLESSVISSGIVTKQDATENDIIINTDQIYVISTEETESTVAESIQVSTEENLKLLSKETTDNNESISMIEQTPSVENIQPLFIEISQTSNLPPIADNLVPVATNDLISTQDNISVVTIGQDFATTDKARGKATIDQKRLIQHIEAFTASEIIEIVDEISSSLNSTEKLKESVTVAKKLHECVAAIETFATQDETCPPIKDICSEEVQLAHKLQNALSTLHTRVLESADIIKPVYTQEILQRVSEIITHLQDDLATVTTCNIFEFLKPNIGKIEDSIENNSMKQLESLLHEVSNKINLSTADKDVEDTESLRDTLDEVQTVIIKLKRDYDGATNDILNETLEDLECSVRSVQLQINEDIPPELLKEAFVTLQLLVNNMHESQEVHTSENTSKDTDSETILEKCSTETGDTLEFLDVASKVDTNGSSNLKNIVSSLTSLKDTMKSLKESFMSDAEILIEKGIDVIQNIDKMEDKVFALEKDIDAEANLGADTRDSIITAVHSVYGSISNMRSTISSIQKRYMLENYGKPSEILLRSMKNITIISNIDSEVNKRNWKKISKSIRNILNHFQDIKFYINLDKTARLPSDAAFTKIILEELKTNIYNLIIPHTDNQDFEITKKVNDTIECVDKNLISIEVNSTLEVKAKIPIFKEVSAQILDFTNLIKNVLQNEKMINKEVLVNYDSAVDSVEIISQQLVIEDGTERNDKLIELQIVPEEESQEQKLKDKHVLTPKSFPQTIEGIKDGCREKKSEQEGILLTSISISGNNKDETTCDPLKAKDHETLEMKDSQVVELKEEQFSAEIVNEIATEAMSQSMQTEEFVTLNHELNKSDIVSRSIEESLLNSAQVTTITDEIKFAPDSNIEKPVMKTPEKCSSSTHKEESFVSEVEQIKRDRKPESHIDNSTPGLIKDDEEKLADAQLEQSDNLNQVILEPKQKVLRQKESVQETKQYLKEEQEVQESKTDSENEKIKKKLQDKQVTEKIHENDIKSNQERSLEENYTHKKDEEDYLMKNKEDIQETEEETETKLILDEKVLRLKDVSEKITEQRKNENQVEIRLDETKKVDEKRIKRHDEAEKPDLKEEAEELTKNENVKESVTKQEIKEEINVKKDAGDAKNRNEEHEQVVKKNLVEEKLKQAAEIHIQKEKDENEMVKDSQIKEEEIRLEEEKDDAGRKKHIQLEGKIPQEELQQNEKGKDDCAKIEKDDESQKDKAENEKTKTNKKDEGEVRLKNEDKEKYTETEQKETRARTKNETEMPQTNEKCLQKEKQHEQERITCKEKIKYEVQIDQLEYPQQEESRLEVEKTDPYNESQRQLEEQKSQGEVKQDYKNNLNDEIVNKQDKEKQTTDEEISLNNEVEKVKEGVELKQRSGESHLKKERDAEKARTGDETKLKEKEETFENKEEPEASTGNTKIQLADEKLYEADNTQKQKNFILKETDEAASFELDNQKHDEARLMIEKYDTEQNLKNEWKEKETDAMEVNKSTEKVDNENIEKKKLFKKKAEKGRESELIQKNDELRLQKELETIKTKEETGIKQKEYFVEKEKEAIEKKQDVCLKLEEEKAKKDTELKHKEEEWFQQKAKEAVEKAEEEAEIKQKEDANKTKEKYSKKNEQDQYITEEDKAENFADQKQDMYYQKGKEIVKQTTEEVETDQKEASVKQQNEVKKKIENVRLKVEDSVNENSNLKQKKEQLHLLKQIEAKEKDKEEAAIIQKEGARVEKELEEAKIKEQHEYLYKEDKAGEDSDCIQKENEMNLQKEMEPTKKAKDKAEIIQKEDEAVQNDKEDAMKNYEEDKCLKESIVEEYAELKQNKKVTKTKEEESYQQKEKETLKKPKEYMETKQTEKAVIKKDIEKAEMTQEAVLSREEKKAKTNVEPKEKEEESRQKKENDTLEKATQEAKNKLKEERDKKDKEQSDKSQKDKIEKKKRTKKTQKCEVEAKPTGKNAENEAIEKAKYIKDEAIVKKEKKERNIDVEIKQNLDKEEKKVFEEKFKEEEVHNQAEILDQKGKDEINKLKLEKKRLAKNKQKEDDACPQRENEETELKSQQKESTQITMETKDEDIYNHEEKKRKQSQEENTKREEHAAKANLDKQKQEEVELLKNEKKATEKVKPELKENEEMVSKTDLNLAEKVKKESELNLNPEKEKKDNEKFVKEKLDADSEKQVGKLKIDKMKKKQRNKEEQLKKDTDSEKFYQEIEDKPHEEMQLREKKEKYEAENILQEETLKERVMMDDIETKMKFDKKKHNVDKTIEKDDLMTGTYVEESSIKKESEDVVRNDDYFRKIKDLERQQQDYKGNVLELEESSKSDVSSYEQHYIKEYQYEPLSLKRNQEDKEKPKFVDHNHRDYTMEFIRPSGYRERTFEVDRSSVDILQENLGKIATIYKANTLVLDAQLRSSTLLYPDTIKSSEPLDRRSDISKRSKALSEVRSVLSEKRTAVSRDIKRKPVFSTYLTDRTAVEGSRVKLTCSVLSSTDPTVTWYRNGVLLDNKFKYRTKFIDGLITLEVLNAIPSDSAEYSCTVENENGSVSTSANLKVYPSFEASPIPPTFTRSIRDTYHLAENELVLECRIRGQPLPTITWLKDDKPITTDERFQAYYLADGICRLAIESPTPEDSGKYTCKAENSVWSDQITHVVHFTGKEGHLSPNFATIEKSRFNRQALESRRPHFTNVLADYNVAKGGTIGLQVEIRGAPTRVEWLREGRSVTEVYRKARTFVEHGLYTLALSDVTEKESGMYTCRAWSNQGNVDMNAAITVVPPNEMDGKPAIIVSRPEKDILISVGEDVNISFRVQGEPKPKVLFMKGIRDITTSQRACKMTSDDYVKFTLKRSMVSDAGTYCILARNAYGCDRAFVTVVVRQRASSENLISDWTYPMDDSTLLLSERKYKSVPDRIPGEPSVVDAGNNWVSLAWPKPDPQNTAPVLAYKVESWLMGKEGGARWVELGITPLNSYDAFNLKQGEEYHFRVTPRNRYGWGESVQTSSPIGVGLAGDSPEFVEILPGQLKVLAGETANLSCSVKGKPVPEIVWMKNGHEVEEEDRRMKTSFNGFDCCLTIKDINLEDEARYSCEATNMHGRASTYARLAVVTDRLIWEADVKLKRERSADVEGDYSPQFTMRLRDRRVQATYPVRLTCQVVGSPHPTVTWFKDSGEVIFDSRHSKYQDELFHTLEIAPTTLEDGGVYEALARNTSGAVSCRCSLVVDKGIRAYVAPEFCCGLEPLYSVKTGEELRICAVVEAYPSVGVTWYRDGVRLRPSRRTVMTLDRDGQIELALASVTPRDAGVYTCTASNEVGRASTSGKVQVIGDQPGEKRTPPVLISPDVPYSKEPMFVRKPRSSEAREGDTVIIQCEVVGDPKPDVYWLRDFLKPDYYRDATHFKRVGAGPQYRFEIPHAKLDYTGAYSVVARNVHGEAKAIISLQILAKDPTSSEEAHNIRYGRVEVIPRFGRELTDLLSYDGDAVEFECRVSGNPEPDIRWFHYNELIRECPDFETSFDQATARLKIKQVTAEDEGTYLCEASNCLGKATSSACLVVYPPGEPNTLSQRLRRPPALFSAASTPRSTPRSTPARSVSRTPGPDTKRLRSPSRQLAPAFYTYPFNKVIEEGDNLTFQCAVKGLPAPWATWDKDGVIITPSARITIREKDEMLRILEIEQVTVEDVGIYRITVENEYGRAEASARLEVITQKGKFYGGLRAYSASPRKSLTHKRRSSMTRQD